MKKLPVFLAIFCLLLAVSAAFAQDKAANFAGNWELDVAKSKLPERGRVESMTMNVTQTDKQLKVQTTSKRAAPPQAPPADPNGGMRPDANRGGGMRGGGMGGGNANFTYSLDGKETTVQQETGAGMPAASVTLKAKMDKGKLQLTSSRSFDTPNGSMSIKTTETWEFVDGGKTLKVTRDMETPRGTQSSEMYFTKKDSAVDSGKTTSEVVQGETVTPSAVSMPAVPRQISGGVLNGKASQLPLPTYPAEARTSKASGAVNVRVEIDEQGNVVLAEAVSGDSTLRAASEEAARNAKFAPTTLSGIPVKVTGVLVYNFVAP